MHSSRWFLNYIYTKSFITVKYSLCECLRCRGGLPSKCVSVVEDFLQMCLHCRGLPSKCISVVEEDFLQNVSALSRRTSFKMCLRCRGGLPSKCVSVVEEDFLQNMSPWSRRTSFKAVCELRSQISSEISRFTKINQQLQD
jgi:hypothetical protein